MCVGGCDFELADCRQLWVGISPKGTDGEPDWQGYDTTGQAVHDVAAWHTGPVLTVLLDA